MRWSKAQQQEQTNGNDKKHENVQMFKKYDEQKKRNVKIIFRS